MSNEEVLYKLVDVQEHFVTIVAPRWTVKNCLRFIFLREVVLDGLFSLKR